jgi:hypothetical protein
MIGSYAGQGQRQQSGVLHQAGQDALIGAIFDE